MIHEDSHTEAFAIEDLDGRMDKPQHGPTDLLIGGVNVNYDACGNLTQDADVYEYDRE